jgi:RNA polymerase sigma factor (TIGR02999 family)
MNTQCDHDQAQADAEPGDITRILNAASHGETNTADALMNAMYARLWQLALAKAGPRRPGQALRATALVDEAWMRHASSHEHERAENRAYFFAAAAEAMQRILVELARGKLGNGRGEAVPGAAKEVTIVAPMANHEDLVAMSDALDSFATHDPRKAELVKLCYFAGLSMEDAADVLGLSVTAANRHWAYARAWLQLEITRSRPVQLVSLSTGRSGEGSGSESWTRDWPAEPWTSDWRDETWTR